MSYAWQTELWINDHFCWSNVSFMRTGGKWSGEQLLRMNKMQHCFRFYSVTVFVDFEVKRWLAFILSLITSFLLVLLCFCLSLFTDMMNVAVALQRVQSHQRVSSGRAQGRINNTKASKYNLRKKSPDTVRNADSGCLQL